MPTPTAARSSQAYDGIVPGMTWADFIKQFTTGTPNGAFYDNGEGFAAPQNYMYDLGQYGNVQRTGGTGGSDQFGNSTGSPVYSYDTGDLGDGTINQFSQGPNGELISKNTTMNNDSWWDSTGLPLVASLAFGAATAGAAAAGVGVDGVTGAAIGNASAGLPGATSTGLNASGNAASVTGSVNDIASANYDPYNPQNWTANAGGTASDASNVATQQPSLWDQALNTAKEYGFGNGPIGSAQNVLNGTGQIGDYLSVGSNANTAAGLAGDLGGSSGTNPFSSIVQSYNAGSPSSTGYVNPFGAGTATGGVDLGGTQSLAFPTSSGGTTNGGLLGSIANLYNNGITSGSAQDYSNILGGAGSLLNGVLGYNSAQNGINAQTTAANNNNALQAAIYANQTALAKPYVDGGTAAFQQQSNLNGLNGTAAQTAAMGQFKTDPGYQFALDQGNRGVQSSAAAQGGLFSGRAAKDLTNYNQGMANQQYGNYYNRLSGQAGIGQAAVAGQAANGNAYVNGTSSNNNAIGNAQTAGGVAGTNAITGAVNGLLNQNSSNQLLNLLLKNQGTGSNGYYMTGTGLS